MTDTTDGPASAVQEAITEPGVYDMPSDVYHADPVVGGSLSSSGARRLLPPSCPALFRHEQVHGRPPKRTFDLGHAAHKLVLGVGEQIALIEADNYNTKAARQDRDAVYAAGAVPLLRHEHRQVHAMAAALRAQPVAAALFNPELGDAEQSAFWIDAEAGIWRRARFDFLRTRDRGRIKIVDYKTTVSAAPDHIERAVYTYGYHMQQAYYLDAVHALGLGDADAQFVFVFQEKTPPYLATVVQISEDAERIGHELNRRAIDIYRDCAEAGRWPAYADDVHTITLPPWIERRHEEEATQ